MNQNLLYQSESLIPDGDEVEGGVIYPNNNVSDKEMDKSFYRQLALFPEQTHSLNVGIVEHRDNIFPETDALITFKRDLPIGIVTADCVPILLYAPDIKGVAAVHAGWRGTLGGIIDRVLDILILRGAEPSKIRAWFGPSISKAKYEVDAELARKFKDAGFEKCVEDPASYLFAKDSGSEVNSKPHIDLQRVNLARMLRRGLEEQNVHLSGACTFGQLDSAHHPLYQSYRRDGDKAGRLLTYIKLP